MTVLRHLLMLGVALAAGAALSGPAIADGADDTPSDLVSEYSLLLSAGTESAYYCNRSLSPGQYCRSNHYGKFDSNQAFYDGSAKSKICAILSGKNSGQIYANTCSTSGAAQANFPRNPNNSTVLWAFVRNETVGANRTLIGRWYL